jgi:TatD DNase family protein
MIDAHCHLYSDKYDHDLDAVIQRARKYLEGVVVSAVDPESLQKSLTIRRQHSDFIHVTAGVHPRTAATLKKEKLAQLWQTIKNVKEEIVAVGEVGPDFHHTRDPRLRQRQLVVLEEAMTQAENLHLPLVIHARQAEAAALEVVSAKHRCSFTALPDRGRWRDKSPGLVSTCHFQPFFFSVLNFRRSPPKYR